MVMDVGDLSPARTTASSSSYDEAIAHAGDRVTSPAHTHAHAHAHARRDRRGQGWRANSRAKHAKRRHNQAIQGGGGAIEFSDSDDSYNSLDLRMRYVTMVTKLKK